MNDTDVNIDELIKKINNNEKTIEELTEEEQKALFIRSIHNSKLTYKPNKLYGKAYKNKRRKKNKSDRKMRKLNK
jgi:hypothetical protein